MTEDIFLYYTSDLHSHFENWPKITRFLNDKKAERKLENQTFWLLDNGDHMDRVHPTTEALLGKGNVALLNQAKYNIATLGNNEGITLEHKDLYHLYDEANFSIVCANLTSSDGANPDWLKPTDHLQTASGIKIGVIGLTAPFHTFYDPLGWKVEDPLIALERELSTLKSQSDIIVLLSHLGINEDESIADMYPDIDVIVGGHTHHLFRDGEYRNQSLLTASGKFGHFVGEIILTWDHQLHQLKNKQAYATQIDHLEEDREAKKLIKQQEKEAFELLDQRVTTIAEPLPVKWFEETVLIRRLTEILLEWTKADIAMLNAGLLLDSLPVGPVTYADIHRICPHPINPCVVELQGQELVEVVRASLTKSFKELELQGFGFRGKVIGKMIYAGIDIKTEIDNDGEERILSMSWKGIPIQPDKSYKLATADMFTFGHIFPEIARSKFKKFYMPEFIRDLLLKVMKSK
ncbi:putative metallophosphoesterase YunD [Paraliobacillus quinghaiensis]|uniref:Metallophosphoesterase YunD n=1 Tax=Paraliobacillus quinghaiensis TaxID=470815 RepID=A0A917TV68_9BACI|nr:bifunctional UDP-sugar hydrolase/5'-nucleotidase [Paraliobacillus quinghaiensis]GGM37328.1 putative metallophosphoesterase YunD [Paraliobacillus quinghaiensis]